MSTLGMPHVKTLAEFFVFEADSLYSRHVLSIIAMSLNMHVLLIYTCFHLENTDCIV